MRMAYVEAVAMIAGAALAVLAIVLNA